MKSDFSFWHKDQDEAFYVYCISIERFWNVDQGFVFNEGQCSSHVWIKLNVLCAKCQISGFYFQAKDGQWYHLPLYRFEQFHIHSIRRKKVLLFHFFPIRQRHSLCSFIFKDVMWHVLIKLCQLFCYIFKTLYIL